MIRRAVVLITILGALAFFATSGIRILNDPQDFRAFYCGATAAIAHADPYRAQPLRACEKREAIAAGLTPYRDLTVPAPLPGYVFLPLLAFAVLPFAGASSLYVLALLAALAATVTIVAKLVPTPLPAIAVALSLAAGLLPLLDGQIVPFALLAICGCALYLKRERYVLASICAACAAIEPHLALPVWIALVSTFPKTRTSLAICAAILGTISLVTIGPQANLEYVTRVLGAQAVSELSATGQFGFATLAFRCGLGAGVSLALGNASYLSTCALGTFAAHRLAKRFAMPEAVALIPAAFVVFGGTYVHLSGMAIAIPALLALAHRFERERAWFSIALILVALPWQNLIANPPFAAAVATAIVAATIARFVWRLRWTRVAVVALGSIALGFCEYRIDARFARPTPDPAAAMALVKGSRELAQATWGAFATIDQNDAMPLYLATHLPDWLGLAIMIACTSFATRLVRNRDRTEVVGG